MTSTKKTIFKTFLVILSALCFSTALAQGIHITPVDTIRPPFPDSLWEYTSVSCISDIGDINQDGYEDLGVSYRFTTGDIAYPYRVVLYMGNATGRFEPLWIYCFPEGSLYSENYGEISTIENIGDINGDGWEDIAIGMPGYGYDPVWNKGRVWVYFGSATMDTIPDWAWSAGDSLWYHGFGSRITKAGDWNGDSYNDFAISAPWNDLGGEGQVYLIYGGNPPDTTSFIEWSGTESEEGFGRNIKATDLNGDGSVELIISNQIGYFSDTITFNIFEYTPYGNDTIFSVSIAGLEDWYGFQQFLSVIHFNDRDIIYSSIYGENRWHMSDSFMLYKVESICDSVFESEIDLREVFSAYDTSIVPMVWNIRGIKDLTGDGIEELLCEYCYSKQNDLGSYRLRTSGRFYILEQSDSLDVIYISDSLFGCSSYLSSYSQTAVLDFNGDGRDEIFHSLISPYCAGNDWEIVVYTTGDWEGIEEQSEITSQNYLAGSYGNTIHFDINISARAEIDLFDITGRKIREEAIDVHKGRNSVSFGELNSGIYLYRIRFSGSDEVLSGKLVNIK